MSWKRQRVPAQGNCKEKTAVYSYDKEGRLTGASYPGAGRLSGLGEWIQWQSREVTWLRDVPYNAAPPPVSGGRMGGGAAVTATVSALTESVSTTLRRRLESMSGSTEEQRVVLLHEAIHYRLQLNDQQIVKLFGIAMGVLRALYDPSAAISAWLLNDCRDIPGFVPGGQNQ